jgi:hypothetical protein
MLVGTGRTDRVIIVKASSVLNVNMTLMSVQKIVFVNVMTMRRYWKMTDDIDARLRAERDQWRNLAMKEHIKFCHLNDHEMCVDYLDWRHNLEMREAGWLGQ